MEDREPEQSRQSRCPGMSYSDLLDLDSREVPAFLRKESQRDMGTAPLSTERYTSPDFMALENEKMWPNVWQFAAREEDFLNPGDHVVYENAGRSYVLVRQDDGDIRAFHNVCLHRGRKLRTKSGFAKELKCPFHGFSWRNDGTLKRPRTLRAVAIGRVLYRCVDWSRHSCELEGYGRGLYGGVAYGGDPPTDYGFHG